MADNGNTCMAKTGLLFLRDCGNLMSRNCQACGRPICGEHSIQSDSGMVCPECAASEGGDLQDDRGVRSAAQRGHYYSRYGYSPYYYGHTHYYSDHDYETFDGTEIEDVPPPDGAVEAVSSEDDYMES